MVKKRVHELAKELKMESREIIQKLTSLGISVRSHMSTVEDHEIQKLIQNIRKSGEEGAVSTKEPSKDVERIKVKEGYKEKKEPAVKPTHRAEGKPYLKSPVYRNDPGPGIVVKVPSRPPDKRFSDRPIGKPVERAVNKMSERPAFKPAERPVDKPALKKPAPFVPGSKPQQQGGSERHSKGGPRLEALKIPKVPQEVERARTDRVKKEVGRQIGRGHDREWNKEEAKYPGKKKQVSPRHPDKGKGPRGYEAERPVHVMEKKPIVIGESVTVQELATKMKKSAAEVLKKLMALGVMANINKELDSDTAAIVASEFGYEVEVKILLDAEDMLMQEVEEDPSVLVNRPCVVTVMGHVDHGKTKLLDAIRHTNVVDTEAGGITQHIGAYQVEHNYKKITFLDTPGHEAFTAMRARGAKVTDIAILVVAADDGVMPQTVEAIHHARAANVPIIVAINKIDKPGSDPERVKQQITEHGLVPEEWGGETIFVPVSAKTGQNLNELLEMILLVAEMHDFKANPNKSARGSVVEAQLDKGRGPVATVLVQNGTLKVGDHIVAGLASGKVRAMIDHKGRRMKKAGPSTPVEVLGLSETPLAGDGFYVVNDDKVSRQIIEKRTLRKKLEDYKASSPKTSLDDLFKQIKEGQVKELNLIIKADVQGSVEAIEQSLVRISTEEVRVNVIHSGVGAITETDIMLAAASNAIIIGFNVRPDVNARKAADLEKIDLRLYRVIYDAINDIKAAMSGLLEPEYREVVIGRAEVRKTFKVSKIGTVAGCYVTEGKIVRDAKVRIIRDGVVIFEGSGLESLKRFKDDVKEVQEGYECGLTVEKYNEIEEGDVIEAFIMEAIKRELA